MRKEKTFDFGHMSVKVHEPTVEQLRSLLSREDLTFSPGLFMTGKGEIPTDLLDLVCDLTPETAKKLTLSEFKEVLEGAREMLLPFFDILEMLGAVAGYLDGMQEKGSKKPSAS